MAAVALACASATTAAHADSGWLGISAFGWDQSPGFFLTPGVSGGFLELPRWSSTVRTGTNVGGSPAITPPLSVQPRLRGVEPGVSVGYVFDDGALPPWMGQRVRIGLAGSIMNYSQSKRFDSILGLGQGIVILHPNGSVAQTYGTGANTPVTESLRMLRQAFDLNLRVASDFPIGIDLTFTPSVALFGGRTIDKYDYTHTGFIGGATLVTFTLDERLRTNVLGGDFSAGLTWRVTPRLAINATGRVGTAWLRTSLEASGACTRAGAAPCTTTAAFTSSSRDAVSIRAGASLGGAVDMRFGTLTIGGFLNYDSKMPGIANPLPTTIANGGPQAGPASIAFGNGLGYGGFLNLRILIR